MKSAGSVGLEAWCQARFSHPGKPIATGYVESFNGGSRDECLNVNQFHWHLSQYERTPYLGFVERKLSTNLISVAALIPERSVGMKRDKYMGMSCEAPHKGWMSTSQ